MECQWHTQHHFYLRRIMDASKGSQLEKTESGFEYMDQFTLDTEHILECLKNLDFNTGKCVAMI